MESILTSIKKNLGPSGEYTHFDPDIIMEINTAFMELTQMGLGPAKGFKITDDSAVWSDFIPADDLNFEGVKTYVELSTKLVFDPPTNSTVLASYERKLAQLAWRLNFAAESKASTEE